MSATVTVTGTPAIPQVLGQAIGGSGVQFANSGGLAFDAPASLNKSLNLYDEVNQFIAQLTAALTTAGYPVVPFALIDQLILILNTIRRNPTLTTGIRVLNP